MRRVAGCGDGIAKTGSGSSRAPPSESQDGASSALSLLSAVDTATGASAQPDVRYPVLPAVHAMSDDDELKRPTNQGDMFVHHPLPYIVKLHVSLGDDTVPHERTWEGYAYSILEAVFQATTSVGGSGFGDERIKVVDMAPDLLAYVRDLLANKYGLRDVLKR